MTKDELVKIVDLVHSHYGDRLPTTENLKKQVYLGWWHALQDIDYVYIQKAINQLVLVETYKLRPAAVRKHALILAGKAPQVPTTAQAWALVQKLTNDVNTGSIQQTEIHECIRQAIAQLGGLTAVSASTNGDRNFFAGVYEPIVRDWEIRAYELPDSD
jgi:hypothetical protein